MKRNLLALLFAFSLNAVAQPVIQNGNNIPAPGLTVPFSYGTPSSGIGSPGPNQTWNFSNVTFNALGGLTTINPATSPFAASFPTANYAYSLGGAYSYFSASSTKMEVLAYSITSPGSGNDYSSNPRTVLKFPFNYNDSQVDTWQKAGGSTNNVTITYDGYGTLITPTATYTNVVRVKEDYGSGADYQWYLLNPLMSILVYDHNSNTLYYAGASATGITENNLQMSLDLYPNPVKDNLVIKISDVPSHGNLKFTLSNVVGQKVKQVSIHSKVTTLSLDNISKGIYFYQLQDEYNTLKTGKIIVD